MVMKIPNGRAQILVALSEQEVLKSVEVSLGAAGFDVVAASDGLQALGKVREAGVKAAILDASLEGMSGHHVLRTMKSDHLTKAIPVIMVSALPDEIDCILAMELGADDHLRIPFSHRELALRLRAIMARAVPQPDLSSILIAGRIALDRNDLQARVDRKPVHLTSVEFRLLLALMQSKGKVLSRERLIESAWGSEKKINVRTVDTHLRRLRCRLGPAGAQVRTVRSFGYRLTD